VKVIRGEYKSAVDVKGRMNFPSKFREELGESFIIAKNIDTDSIKVYHKKDWEDLVIKIKGMPQTQTASLQRFLFGSAHEAEPDKQGRIVLPAPLREYAKIGPDSESVVVGIEGYAEIWNKANWERLTDTENREKLMDIAVGLGI